MRTAVVGIICALLVSLLAVRPAAAEKIPFDLTLVSDAGNPLRNLSDAQQLLAHSSAPAILLEAHRDELRFANGDDWGFGPFGKNHPFPHARGFDRQNFALETSAWIDVPTAGAWTFGVASDDGFSMTVNGQTFDHNGRRAMRSTLETVDFPTAGDYPIEVTYFQHLAGAELEVFAAPGTHTKMGPRQGFHLINANNFESLQVVDAPAAGDPPPSVGTIVPEPATMSLLVISMPFMLLRRKR